MVEIVFLAGNPSAQTGLGQRRNRLHQRIVRPLGLSNGLAPGGFGGFGNNWEIRLAGELDFLTCDPAEGCTIPRSNVKHELPDAVSIGHRPGCGRAGVYVLQQLDQSGPVPGVAFEGTAELVGDEGGFGAWRDHVFSVS